VGESHVLAAMGCDPKLGALRLSLGVSTTREEIERVLAAFAKVAGRLNRNGQAA
jgi:cysteine desulfurase